MMRPIQALKALIAASTLCVGAATQSTPRVDPIIIYIGVDYADLESAVAAIPRIRNSIDPNRPIVLQLPPGIIRLKSPVTIGLAHGGNANGILTIRGAPDGSTQIMGAVPVETYPATMADFHGADIPPNARTFSIRNMEVPKGGLRPRGVFVDNKSAAIEIFQGNVKLRNSRWPNSGYADASLIKTDGSDVGPTVRFPFERQTRWVNEPFLWVGGRWSFGWDFEFGAIRAVDERGRFAIVAERSSKIPPAKTPKLFVSNAFSEIDLPGEYAVNSRDKTVSFIPIGNKDLSVEVSVLSSLLLMDNAKFVKIDNVGFSRTLGAAVIVKNSRNIVMDHCYIRDTGGDGIVVEGGHDVTIKRSVVSSVAERGIVLSGGTRTNLKSANHLIVETIISNFGLESPDYRPGVVLSGVGNSLIRSLITGGEHAGVILWGNNHKIVDNEISDVALNSDDVGAIYMGRDWTHLGNIIEGNYIHNIGSKNNSNILVSGIYLDDQISGTKVSKNKIDGGNIGVFIGGGHDNVIINNIFMNQSSAAIRFDDRGLRWHAQKNAWDNLSINEQLIIKMNAVPVKSISWKLHYPKLNNRSTKDFPVPTGNIIQDNFVLTKRFILPAPSPSGRWITNYNNFLGITHDDIRNFNNSKNLEFRKFVMFSNNNIWYTRMKLMDICYMLDYANISFPFRSDIGDTAPKQEIISPDLRFAFGLFSASDCADLKSWSGLLTN